MDDLRPKLICIMPDYGPCIATDEDELVCDIAHFFESHPQAEAITAIEDKLYGLAQRLEIDDPTDNPYFCWVTFHATALTLAQQLSILLADTDVVVSYKKHYNDDQTTGQKKWLLSSESDH